MFIVVIFFATNVGYWITNYAYMEMEYVQKIGNKYVEVQGIVDKITESEYGWNIYLRDVYLMRKNNSAVNEKSHNTLKNGDVSEKSDNIINNGAVNEKTYNIKYDGVNTYELHKIKKIIVYYDEDCELKLGNLICVKGRLEQFDRASNTGNFDSKNYYKSLGIYGKIKANTVEIQDNQTNIINEKLYEMKLFFKKCLDKICGGRYEGIFSLCNDKSGIFAAILLGEKSDLDTEIKDLYSVSGISHILAISGLHISFIGMFVYTLMRKKFRFLISAIVSMILVIGFGIMSGLGISTMRAMSMFGLRLLGEVLGRTYDSLSAVSTAGLVVLLENPFAIFNSGFQLSFMAIFAIVIIWPKVCSILQLNTEHNDSKGNGKIVNYVILIKSKIIHSALFCLTINLVLNPIIAYNYFQLPTYSFLLNMIVVPLMSAVIMSGILGICGVMAGVILGRILILPACGILEFYTWLCNLINKLPYANIIVGKPSLKFILIYYLGLICFIFVADSVRNYKTRIEKEQYKKISKYGRVIESKAVQQRKIARRNFKFRLSAGLLFMLFNIMIYCQYYIVNYSLGNKTKMQISFLDVGQGDGIFIRNYDGKTILVDGGSSTVKKLGRYRIIPFLKAKCIRKVDYAMVSHADTDHISGLKELLVESDSGGIKIVNLVMPDIGLKDDSYNELITCAKKHKVNVMYIKTGGGMKLTDTEIKCLYPDSATVASDRNDYSTVLSLHYGEFSMLLTGDISMKVEKNISNQLNDNYMVLKIPHHGSNYSTSDDLLRLIQPRYSVISVGKDNSYGHPGTELMERLEKCRTNIFRTDECGEVTMKTDGDTLEIITMK